MKMRLLEKNEIDARKAQEQASHVQEGLKIARRVDSLREIHAAEEESLRKFRNETIAKINAEITKETERREILITGNAKLEKERAKLLEPLDEQKKELEEKGKLIAQVTEAAETAMQEAFTEREKAREENREARNNRTRTNGYLAEARRLNRIASDKSAEAEGNLRKANKIRSEAESFSKTVHEDHKRKESELRDREAGIVQRESEVRSERERLDLEWQKLKDRNEMFERRIKRINK